MPRVTKKVAKEEVIKENAATYEGWITGHRVTFHKCRTTTYSDGSQFVQPPLIACTVSVQTEDGNHLMVPIKNADVRLPMESSPDPEREETMREALVNDYPFRVPVRITEKREKKGNREMSFLSLELV